MISILKKKILFFNKKNLTILTSNKILNFHRCSYFLDRPAPPGKPYLAESDVTPDVLTIRWDRPLRDGGSPITGYLVEHRRTGSPHWVRANPLLTPFPQLTLSGLEPGWRYQFRVFAENAVGMSDASDLSEALTVTMQR